MISSVLLANDYQEGTVILTGGSFNFVKGNASTNLTIEFAKAYKHLGFIPRIVPQNPSFTNEEEASGEFIGIPYSYPLKNKNVFSGYSGWRKSLNYRIGVLINPLVTSRDIWLHRKKISLVFSQTLRPMTLLILALTCRLSGVPLIYHLVEEPWTLGTYKDTAWWRRLARIIQDAVPIFLLYMVILRMTSFVACINEELVVLLKKWGYVEKQLFYLPNVRYTNDGDLGRRCTVGYSSKTTGSLLATPYVMYSGQISYTKEAFDPLLNALGQINEKSVRLKLRLYGGGNPHAIHRLKNMIADLEIGHYVEFFGFVSREELQEAQKNTILCLLLKRNVPFNRFNFPTKLIDYLGAGKAVLMSDLPLHKKFFTDKIDSLIVDPELSKEIRLALEWALEHPNESKIIGHKASLKLQEHFDACDNVQRLLEFALIDIPCNDEVLGQKCA